MMTLGFKGLSTVHPIRLPGFLYDMRPINSLRVAIAELLVNVTI